MQHNKNLILTIKLLFVSVCMFAFVFVVMVPLYNVLCDILGINGKTSGKSYTPDVIQTDTDRFVNIQFVTSNNQNMPWVFEPQTVILKVNPGAVNNTVFYAKNITIRDMTAQAIPSISPARAAAYFHKTECFCFDKQYLDAQTETDMPLQFIVDQDLPADIKTITLSYTIFDISD